MLNSLIVGDETSAYPLRVDTPSGPVWHRFTYDGYGEQADGRDWDLFFDNPARQTRGRLWPLLTGERGEYELIAGRSAAPFLRTIANTANDGLMLPEQVWDDQPPPGERSGAGHALGDAAGVDAWPVRPPRVVDRRRPADRAPLDRRLPLPARAVSVTRTWAVSVPLAGPQRRVGAATTAVDGGPRAGSCRARGRRGLRDANDRVAAPRR